MPLATEAPTLEELLVQVFAVVRQIAIEKELAAIDEEVVIRLIAKRAVTHR